MIVDDENKFIFVHIPKNSGTTMSKVLKDKYTESKLLMWVDEKTGIDKMHLYVNVIWTYIDENKCNKYMKFCIIRNPYDRVYSAWKSLKKQYPEKDIDLFVKKRLNQKFINKNAQYNPQHIFIFDKQGKQFVDEIINFNNINDDINNLNIKYNLNIPLYGNQKTEKPTEYNRYFNKESIDIINNLYEKDFDLLGFAKI
jgi:hypothetical protein